MTSISARAPSTIIDQDFYHTEFDQDFYHTEFDMKSTELSAYRKGVLGDKVLPRVGLKKWSDFEHGLKRTKCIYFRGNNDDIISRPMPPPKEQPVELPGIRSKEKMRKCGNMCVYDKKSLNGSFTFKTRLGPETTSSSSHDFNRGKETGMKYAEGECSLGANSISSSATGSESWTSGNGSTTSPRRRIRVPTAMAISPGAVTDDSKYSKLTSVQRSPQPPSKPRNVFLNPRSKKTDRIFLGNDGHSRPVMQNDHSGEHHEHGEGNHDQCTSFRSKTPVFGKSRHFKATTLQNIMESCHPQYPSECDTKKMKKRVQNPSSRRRSVGNLLNNRADHGNDEVPSSHSGRRGSMPVDIRELKEKVDGIRFINVREFSRDYIENILLRRDKKATKGIAGDERRQSKCLSWLQSLEGAL